MKKAETDRKMPMQHQTPDAAHRWRQTLTVPEAGKVLGIGRSAAYEAARTGEIPTIRIGRRILVPAMALDRLLAEGSIRTAQQESQA